MKGIVLSLCDLTGNMVKPWLEAGYECWTVDLQHTPGETHDGRLVRVGADVRYWLPPRTDYAIAFAFPPCTNLAVSGARWFAAKGPRIIGESMMLVGACLEILNWTGAPWMIENPVGLLSTHWRPPDHIFDPCDYGGYLDIPGDAYTKKTCLWTGNGFQMPPPRPVAPTIPLRIRDLGSAARPDERRNLRSETPMGFARAVFESNNQAKKDHP